MRHAISTLEQAVLRGPRPKPGHRRPRARARRRSATTSRSCTAPIRAARLTPGQLQNAADLVAAFADALKPLEALAKTRQPLDGACRRAPPGHRRAVAERRGDGVAFAGPDGTALDRAFEEIADNAQRRRRGRRVGLSRPVPRHRRREAGAPARPAGRARAHLRSARSAPAIDRPRRARRAGRGRVAAGDAQRSLAQPSDAPRPRPRPAGAAHLALGARLRADARRRRGRARLSGQARRRADGAVALPAAAGGGRRRAAMGRGARARRALSRLGARARPAGGKPRPVQRPEPKPARDARPTSLSVTEIETWLRDPYSIYARHILRAAAARRRSTRRPARATAAPSSMARSASSRRSSRMRLPDDAVGELIRLGEQEFAVLEDFPEARRSGGRASCASRAGSPISRRSAALNVDRHQRGDRRQARDPARQPRLHAAHPRRPHRASARRQLRDPRLQDRPAADRAAGVDRAHAATDARRRDPARREIRRHSGRRIDRGSPLRLAARRRSRRRAEADRVQGQHARRKVRRGAARSSPSW